MTLLSKMPSTKKKTVVFMWFKGILMEFISIVRRTRRRRKKVAK